MDDNTPWWQNLLMFLAVLPTVGGLILLALHLAKVVLLDILPHLSGR